LALINGLQIAAFWAAIPAMGTQVQMIWEYDRLVHILSPRRSSLAYAQIQWY